jgi:hypothetical protein
VTATQDRGPTITVHASPGELVIEIPDDAPQNSKVHVIVEAVDDGVPALSGYARLVLTIA